MQVTRGRPDVASLPQWGRIKKAAAGRRRDFEEPFQEAVPAVYDYIRAVNRHDHRELIRQLQQLESWLVIHQVAPRLMGRVPCVTLHDAIYSTLSALGVVETAGERSARAIERFSGYQDGRP